MQRRKVTVHFGPIRVVVPCPDEEMTVEELSQAAIQRYKKATGMIESDVRVHRLECLRDGGILISDDRISDVFDESKDQILAIYDEQSPNGSGGQITSPITSSSFASSFNSNNIGPIPLMTSSPVLSRNGNRPGRPTSTFYTSPHYSGMSQSASMDFPNNNNRHPPPPYGKPSALGKVRESVVEVKNANSLPPNGLMVYSPSDGAISSSPPVRSSLRSGASTPSRNRVTLSPEVEKKLNNSDRSTSGRFARNSARKSRISETYYDAQAKLEAARQAAEDVPSASRLYFLDNPNQTFITFPDGDRTPMGLEVEPIYENPEKSEVSRRTQHLLCVQITKIEADGRVGIDGRLKIGDRIVAIDSRPVSQMSILRARAYLADLQEKLEPTLTIDRPMSSFQEEASLGDRNLSANSSQRKPILSALQKANTKAIGQTISVDLVKSSQGFGFTVTGRETAAGERLFYIGTVKPNGVALGHLRAGDRLLEVNGEKTADLTQPEVVDRLKQAKIGQKVVFLVSRMGEEEEEKAEDESNPEVPTVPPVHPISTIVGSEEHEYIVPLNSTGSAGLGIRLKARVTIKSDKTRSDCGIFIKAILTGGAADKDGRLQVDDRIVGIENLRLDGDSNNEANHKIAGCFKALSSASHAVRLIIQRRTNTPVDQPITVESDGHSNPTLTATPSPISLRFSQSSDDKRSSITSDIRGDDFDQISPDAFDREAPTRKSMSEKRGMGTSNDPNHIRLFQDIKHQRQTSAPPPSSASRSSFGQSRSASQRAQARARSQSVHPRSPNQNQTLEPPAPTELGARRSLSMESINRTPQGSRREEASPHPYPPGTEISVEKRENGVNKDKTRRKSVGSAMKSWFGFLKETSPDRERLRQDIAHQEEEDRRRVQEHYDRLRQREAATNRNLSATSLPRPAYTHQSYPPPLSPPLEQPLIISNSRFYASQRARSSTTITTSTTDIKPIVIPRNIGVPPPVPSRRPITTHFPVENNKPIQKNGPCRDEQPPTIITCSTRGSHTAAAEPLEQHRSSRPLSEGRRSEEFDRRREPNGQDNKQRNSTFLKQNPPSSTPIAFPTTRFAFTPSSQISYTGVNERLSMRARKNKRREVVSMAESTPPSTPQNRLTTSFDEPSTDYCSVWNQWNSRTGASLPARRPRPPRPKLNQTVFEAITDC